MLYYKQNEWPALSSAVKSVRVLTPGKLLPNPKAAVADPLPKHRLFGWWSSPVSVTKSLKVAVADSGQSTIATRRGM